MSYTNTLVNIRRIRIIAAALILGVLVFCWGGTVFASDGVNPEVSQSVVLAEEHGVDSEANLPFLFAVYIITWGGFFAYTFAMSRRQREMQREIYALKAAIADKEFNAETGRVE